MIALERMDFPTGAERRGGPKEAALDEVRLATPWNPIEAAMAYSRGHPLMVIVEQGLRAEGLLERGYDWYVQSVAAEPAALTTPEFNGVLSSCKQKLAQGQPASVPARSAPELTIGELVGGMKPAQLWSLLASLAALLAGAFALGGKLFGA